MNPKAQRRIKLPYPKKGPAGERYCRWCGKQVPKGRQTWCSQTCVREYKLRNDAGYLRHQVFQRDHGICARCGIDTEAERKRLQADARAWMLENRLPDWRKLFPGSTIGDWHRAAEIGRGYSGWPAFGRSWWEADHILEIVNGGAEMGLQNIQTLCVPCHRAKTAELAKDRARYRQQNFHAQGGVKPGMGTVGSYADGKCQTTPGNGPESMMPAGQMQPNTNGEASKPGLARGTGRYG